MSVFLINKISHIIHRLSNIWMLITRAKLVYWFPPQNNLIIFDGMNLNLLDEIINDWDPEVIYIRGESVNIACLLCSLFYPGRIKDAYIDAYISFVQPKLVITLFDNDIRFIELRYRHPSVKTLFIQNGLRSYYGDIFELLDNNSFYYEGKLMVDYMLVFGNEIGEEYAKYIKGKSISIGSYKNNRIPRSKFPDMNKLAFISQYCEGTINIAGRLISSHDLCFQTDVMVIDYLRLYSKERNKNFVVIPRYSNEWPNEREREERYYRKIIGEDCIFMDQFGEFPSYHSVDSAGVSVAIDTTLGYESISRGNRTVIFSIRGEILKAKGFCFGWPAKYPDTGSFWTNLPQRCVFEDILDRAYSISKEEWEISVRSEKFYNLMTRDHNNKIIKSILVSELGEIH